MTHISQIAARDLETMAQHVYATLAPLISKQHSLGRTGAAELFSSPEAPDASWDAASAALDRALAAEESELSQP